MFDWTIFIDAYLVSECSIWCTYVPKPQKTGGKHLKCVYAYQVEEKNRTGSSLPSAAHPSHEVLVMNFNLQILRNVSFINEIPHCQFIALFLTALFSQLALALGRIAHHLHSSKVFANSHVRGKKYASREQWDRSKLFCFPIWLVKLEHLDLVRHRNCAKTKMQKNGMIEGPKIMRRYIHEWS